MRALVITSNYGVEQDEILAPVNALRNAGHHVNIAASTSEPVQTLVFDRENGEVFAPDSTMDAEDSAEYDLLVIPGGTINADTIRTDESALALVTGFAESGKIIASMCHGPWLLAEAGLLGGKTLTSWSSLATDLRNAGGTWVDRELVTDTNNGWTLITSRSPFDLDTFNSALLKIQV